MRLLAGALLTTAALAASAGAPTPGVAAHRSHRSVCHTPTNERIVARNAFGVISDRRTERPAPAPSSGVQRTDDYFGCLKRIGRRFAIGHTYYVPKPLPCGVTSDERGFHLDGPFVTFVRGEYFTCLVAGGDQVEQYDLRTGVPVFASASIDEMWVREANPSPISVFVPSAGSRPEPELLVVRDGHAAWVLRGSSTCGEQRCYWESLAVRERKWDPTSAAYPPIVERIVATYRVRAGATELQISGIKLTSDSVSWVRGGRRRSARLH